MSAEQPTNADISREFRQDIGEIKTSFGKIETKLNFHFIGFVLILGIMVWLHADQNARINRVEERIVSRLEISGSDYRNTACQCEKTE